MRIVDNTIVLVKNPLYRRLAYLAVALVAAFLIFFPRPYVARAKIVPQDTSATAASTTSLLGALGGGSQSIGSLLTGGKPSNEVYMIIGRSDTVQEDVIKALDLVGAGKPFEDERKAKIWLGKKVDVHLLLGGVMEIETKLFDPSEAVRITSAYANAISTNLARFGQQLITNKSRIVQRRFDDAAQRVSVAEAQLNTFRRANNLADPEAQLGSALAQRAQLEAQLKSKQVEYQTLSQFRGPESNELAAIQSDIAGLQAQIARSATPRTSASGPNVAGLTAVELRYLNLFRDLRFQQAIYDVYQRSREQVEVEELAAESASYIQVIDPAGLDPKRQYNVWAIAVFAGVLLLALFTEWYGPATGLFRRRGHRVEASPVEEFA
ncbi:capsule biosynthesis protein [Sphingomonas sp. GCM10030256]|uniref:capsule biosynthesis protein n=1 Tax=Sphingomonas sp. GCM10030256 TaxID=3273427 RepID=UPI0036192638